MVSVQISFGFEVCFQFENVKNVIGNFDQNFVRETLGFCQFFFCEVDKKKETFPVTGKMHVEVPADVTPEELKQIESVLKQTIAKSLGCNPEQMKLTIDPETGEATYVVTTNDPTLAEHMTKVLKTDDFAQNVNQGIADNSQHLPQKIRDSLAINDVNVTSLFKNNKRKTGRTPTFLSQNFGQNFQLRF